MLVDAGLSARSERERQLLLSFRRASLDGAGVDEGAQAALAREKQDVSSDVTHTCFALVWCGAVRVSGRAELMHNSTFVASTIKVDALGTWMPFVEWYRVVGDRVSEADESFRRDVALEVIEGRFEMGVMTDEEWRRLSATGVVA